MSSEQQIECWAATEVSGTIKPWSYTPRPLQDNEVNVKILACGICGR